MAESTAFSVLNKPTRVKIVRHFIHGQNISVTSLVVHVQRVCSTVVVFSCV